MIERKIFTSKPERSISIDPTLENSSFETLSESDKFKAITNQLKEICSYLKEHDEGVYEQYNFVISALELMKDEVQDITKLHPTTEEFLRAHSGLNDRVSDLKNELNQSVRDFKERVGTIQETLNNLLDSSNNQGMATKL